MQGGLLNTDRSQSAQPTVATSVPQPSMFRPPARYRRRSSPRIARVTFSRPVIVQGAAFPGNTIPACMLDPNAQALL